MTFAPSNPTSYMYLQSERYKFINANFVQHEDPNCPEFIHYIYGVKERAKYLEQLTVKELRENFSSKKVIYLMAEADNGTDMLDRSCEAKLQGVDRFERSINFHYYTKKHLPSSEHTFLSIPSVGHEKYIVP